ncbi:MOSC domain-containing protein [Ensifer soli]|uniref:MOSC domain-containing protein n=1 Tax=Ciceribacter sp. sgz301302 TaxID=3342379 RepID=UPI0035B87CE4
MPRSVTQLNIHPLKSGRAIPLDAVDVARDGFAGDRRFMLIDETGAFITQRELPALARVEARGEGSVLHLAKDGAALTLRFDPERRLGVTVWGTTVDAAISQPEDDAVLSDWFAKPVRLAHMDARAARLTSATWTGIPVPVGFADGYPILVTTTGSLADLNRTLVGTGGEAVGMDRFRTNILIDCDEPWAEDRWRSIAVGGIVLDLVKPCARCIMTTQDQTTGARTGGNPIAGLAEKRMSADRRVPGVLFGWNAVARGPGRIALGDPVTVIERRDAVWPMKRRGG